MFFLLFDPVCDANFLARTLRPWKAKGAAESDLVWRTRVIESSNPFMKVAFPEFPDWLPAYAAAPSGLS
jgi:hypothetical protein